MADLAYVDNLKGNLLFSRQKITGAPHRKKRTQKKRKKGLYRIRQAVLLCFQDQGDQNKQNKKEKK